ncbi:chromosomal replication initiator protein DnaA [Acetitomaculum ruminis DSM 5522]|uniref:Chromosomal replication initiator protein DnaA n=1 Tax=Acetitomaculum ruminis DSM 5522 TaxID=1120918 RepID=A0A1I0ZEB1_9FIRM|nr:chromosomal replication initiator protein DnaA [Acetitomaculum ruminis]SFB23737.1 chromosomal replication initiator protein DnaA [Acetitomaculum ruminis DSM 5522]
MDSIKEKWNDILETVRKDLDISEVRYKNWLEPFFVYDYKDNILTLAVDNEGRNDSFLNYIRKNYLLSIKVAVTEVTGKECSDIELILVDKNEKVEPPKHQTFSRNSNDRKYTFETFVVGSNNRLAYSACLAVAEAPGEIYNPLFLYGGVGLGKTHLMRSIENYILENYPEKKVLYITSESFTNELIEAIRNGNNTAMTKFRDKYRNIDVLLIDDIQFIIGKESTQEEFFHTFNALHQDKKQIILSSDKPPKDFETLEDRLKSRFEMGLMADIGAPDYETRVAILRKKEELDHYSFDDDVINYIATNVKSNIRELEGALNKLIAYSKLEKTPITLDLAERELQNLIFPNRPIEITPEFIIGIVAEHFHISVSEISSKKRSNEVAYPRQIAMYLCREMTSAPLKSIGALLGKKDHTTIIYGIDKIGEKIKSDEKTREVIEILKKKITPN